MSIWDSERSPTDELATEIDRPSIAETKDDMHSTGESAGMLTTGQIERWLREDVGHHDVSNQLPGSTTGRLVAKEPGVVAGLDATERVFEYVGGSVTDALEEGSRVEPGDNLLVVSGPTRELLRGERLAVNLAGHASGIATKTHRAVEAAASVSEGAVDGDDVESSMGSPPRIAATRKTTPGLRGLEKRAVAAGGGDTHRLDLSHMVMVKDNHVAEFGLEGAIEHLAAQASFATKIEVEVERADEVVRAAEAGADAILLDNMRPDEVRDAVETLADAGHGDVLTEASGGIGLDEVRGYAETGVDVISMGALTHSAPSLDLSFRTEGDAE